MPPNRFSPTGTLDLVTDPALLGDGDMVRCTNLDLSEPGVARTRKGISKVSTHALTGTAYGLMESGGKRYAFVGTGIYENEVRLATGMTAAEWHAVAYQAYNDTAEAVFCTNGTDKKRIQASVVREWGITAPATAPTVTGTVSYAYTFAWEKTNSHASGNVYKFTTTWSSTYETLYAWESSLLDDEGVTADSATIRPTYWFEITEELNTAARYGVRYTYARKSAGVLLCESNPSEAVFANLGSGLAVTWTASADAQVTHVRLYRTLSDGGEYYYADEVAIGTTSTALSPDDQSLGAALEEDHDRLPLAVTALAGPDYNGYLFAAVGNKVYWSKAKQPEYWPAAYYVEVGGPQSPITALELHNGQLWAFTRRKVILIQGTGASSFFPYTQTSLAGAVSAQGTLSTSLGILRAHSDGIYLWTGSQDSRITDRRLRPVFEKGEDTGAVQGYYANGADEVILLARGSKVWCLYPSASDSDCDQVIVFDFEAQKVTHHDYGRGFVRGCIDVENDRLLVMDEDGWILRLENGTTDDGEAISWQLETKVFGDTLRRLNPRWCRYDVEITTGSATGDVMLDGKSVQTHTLTSRDTRKRLIGVASGRRLSQRLAGSGVAAVRQTEIE